MWDGALCVRFNGWWLLALVSLAIKKWPLLWEFAPNFPKYVPIMNESKVYACYHFWDWSAVRGTVLHLFGILFYIVNCTISLRKIEGAKHCFC